MPIRKFKSVEEMGASVWLERDDPDLWETIKAVWARSWVLFRYSSPRGVTKHRSIEAKNQHDDRRERADVERARRRATKPTATR